MAAFTFPMVHTITVVGRKSGKINMNAYQSLKTWATVCASSYYVGNVSDGYFQCVSLGKDFAKIDKPLRVFYRKCTKTHKDTDNSLCHG
jgi:hypothetical protein